MYKIWDVFCIVWRLYWDMPRSTWDLLAERARFIAAGQAIVSCIAQKKWPELWVEMRQFINDPLLLQFVSDTQSPIDDNIIKVINGALDSKAITDYLIPILSRFGILSATQLPIDLSQEIMLANEPEPEGVIEILTILGLIFSVLRLIKK